MGTTAIATCECGYSAGSMRLGRGMSSFINYHPCLCEKCEEVIIVNISFRDWNEESKKIKCDKCEGYNAVMYNDEKLVGELGNYNLIDGEYGLITNGSYYCPKCKKMSLRFIPLLSNWD